MIDGFFDLLLLALTIVGVLIAWALIGFGVIAALTTAVSRRYRRSPQRTTPIVFP